MTIFRTSILPPVLVVALAAAMGLGACGSDDAGGAPAISNADSVEAATFEYAIPAGAGEALDAGQPLEILPAELEAHVGDTIRIVNHDDRGHNVGPFFVGAGETMTQRFASPGDFVGICTVHPSGQFTLHVEA
jgi:plastocyanin